MVEARTLRAGGVAAGVAWLSGVSMTLLTKGADVQASQTVELKDKLLTIVQAQPDLLLKVMGFDTLFVMGYATVFCALFAVVPRDGRLLAAVGLGFGLLAALCDTVENVLYGVYGLAGLHHVPFTPELPFHYYVSSLKWISAFGAVGFLTLVFPRRSWFEWLVSAVMVTFPLGGALSIAFPDLLPLRALFFVVGMPLFAVLFFRRAGGRGPSEAAA